jgi:hypothetical protein
VARVVVFVALLAVTAGLYASGPKYEHRVYTEHVERTWYQVQMCEPYQVQKECDWLNDSVSDLPGANWPTKAAAQRFLRKPHRASFYETEWGAGPPTPKFHRIVRVNDRHPVTRRTTRRLPAWERIGKATAGVWTAIVGGKKEEVPS